jgi:hypothetical protein
MTSQPASEFVAECLWPGVRADDLRALDERATDVVVAEGGSVRYLGSLLMREDEVVLCLFCGELEAIRRVADAARIPYDRILETAHSPWPGLNRID